MGACAGGDETDDVVQPGGSNVPCAAELLDGGGEGDGGEGCGNGFGGDEPAHDGADDGLRVRVREEVGVDEMEGSGGRGGAADETGGAELFGDMFGVVVVRDSDGSCWLLG